MVLYSQLFLGKLLKTTRGDFTIVRVSNAINTFLYIFFRVNKKQLEKLLGIFRKDRFDDEKPIFAGFSEKFFKLIKVLTYGFLFIVLLASVVASRGGLQILATFYRQSSGGEEVKYQANLIDPVIREYMSCIVIIICYLATLAMLRG